MKPWNGNSGDALIWLGTEHLLKDLGIARTRDPRKADVILIPGGNQTMWQDNIDVWKEAGRNGRTRSSSSARQPPGWASQLGEKTSTKQAET